MQRLELQVLLQDERAILTAVQLRWHIKAVCNNLAIAMRKAVQVHMTANIWTPSFNMSVQPQLRLSHASWCHTYFLELHHAKSQLSSLHCCRLVQQFADAFCITESQGSEMRTNEEIGIKEQTRGSEFSVDNNDNRNDSAHNDNDHMECRPRLMRQLTMDLAEDEKSTQPEHDLNTCDYKCKYDQKNEEGDEDDELDGILLDFPEKIRLASQNAEREGVHCCICDELVAHGVGHLRLGCRCLCHETCFVSYIRSKSRSDWGSRGGIACPYGLGAGMCAYAKMKKKQRIVKRMQKKRILMMTNHQNLIDDDTDENDSDDDDGDDEYRITPKDLQQLLKVMGCAERSAVASSSLSPLSSSAFLADAVMTVEEIQKYEKWIVEFQEENEIKNCSDMFTSADESTKLFINATTKACPTCGLRTTHFHGHSCHHIFDGCDGCKEEYCYRCLSSARENLEKRGDTTCCLCGSWETFCNHKDLAYFLVCEPYPHDSRCGCTICPDCRLDCPCDMCDGSCVVCIGIIEPPPLDIKSLETWQHTCHSEPLPPGSIYVFGTLLHSVSGVYLPDEDFYSEQEPDGAVFPSYTKKAYFEDDVPDGEDIRMVLAPNGDKWCWKIYQSSDDYILAYVEVDVDCVVLPHELDSSTWWVNINGNFEARATINARLVEPNVPVSDVMMSLLQQATIEIQRKRKHLLVELAREPRPGAVVVSGLSGIYAKANGIYEPSNDIFEGLPIYYQKGNNAHYLSYEIDSLGNWWRIREDAKPAVGYQCFTSNVEASNTIIGLPHEYDKNCVAWKVWSDADCMYIIQRDVTISLYDPLDLLNLPVELTEQRNVAELLINASMSEQKCELLRHPVEGSIEFGTSRAEGIGMPHLQGIFEPTKELKNGLPIYYKKGYPSVSLMNSSVSRWEVWAPILHNKNAFVNKVGECLLKEGQVLPSQATEECWKVLKDKNNFVRAGTEYDMKVSTFSSTLLPNSILDILSPKYRNIIRKPVRGSVVIMGATGSCSSRVNGIFEPTKETYNDMPVFRKKEDGEMWMELVTGSTGGLRWYIKPTENRGESSVCFGYTECDKKNLTLPHDTGDRGWYVYDGASFVKQDTATSALVYRDEPVPGFLLAMQKARQEELDVENAEKEALWSRPPLPGSMLISGATGSRAYGVNGIFEPTDEVFTGMPCYKKKGEEIWAEVLQGPSGLRWHIKPTANRGKSSVCFAYCKFDEEDPAFPFERPDTKWFIYDGSAFSEQAGVTTMMIPTDEPIPEKLLAIKAKCKSDFAEIVAARKAELAAPPRPGSILLSGATGSRRRRINGIFEPTGEDFNGMPVYKKKGDNDTWLEMVVGMRESLCWYIKPYKERGHSTVCFAYLNINPSNINLPQYCTEGKWNLFHGTYFKEHDVSCKIVPEDQPVPQSLLDMVEARRTAQN